MMHYHQELPASTKDAITNKRLNMSAPCMGTITYVTDHIVQRKYFLNDSGKPVVQTHEEIDESKKLGEFLECNRCKKRWQLTGLSVRQRTELLYRITNGRRP